MQIIRNKPFITASLVALCLALAAQPAQADWIQVSFEWDALKECQCTNQTFIFLLQDSTVGGQRVFQAAFDAWTE